MKKIHSTTLAISSALVLGSSLTFGNALVSINESFVGMTTGNINGQNTSPTPGDYFDGTETWEAATTAFSDRGYRGSTTSLSYNGLGGAGGSVEVFRDNTFNSGVLGTRASLTPTTKPSNLAYDTSGSLYFSFLVNFDGYTARADDGVQQGVLVDFEHDTSTTSRVFGVHIGGATGGDSNNFGLSLQTQSKSNIEQNSWDLVDTGLNLASGTNLVQLRIVHSGSTVSGDARYELSLNPSGPGATPDFVHEEQFGLAKNNPDYGFESFGISQSLNDEQSVLVDELYLGETSAVPVPEPNATAFVAILLLAGMAVRRRCHVA
ncbi:MAG: hypothetical protein ACLFU4_01970 [Opitutales bacterium]